MNFQTILTSLKKQVTPFEETRKISKTAVITIWSIFIIGLWFSAGMKETHLFPTMTQVWEGFTGLWSEGLATHIGQSLKLCGEAVLYAIIVSLSFAYLSSLPILKPISRLLSKFRYLPLTGISFYITMLMNDARTIQVWILVVFMTTFLITGLLSMINDIPDEEYDHARALGYNRWHILWEVVILGRLDYVIETIRQNLAIVWMMLVTVESIMVAAGGLGFLIKNSNKFMNHGRIIALQICILLVGLGLDYGLTKLRKVLFRYSKI